MSVKVTLFDSNVWADIVQMNVKERSCWSRVGPNVIQLIPQKTGEGEGRGDDQGKMDTELPMSQGRAGATKNQRRLKELSFLRGFSEVYLFQNLPFGLLVSRTMGEYISVISSHLVCGIFATATTEN